MISRRITSADVSYVTGLNRHKLRAFLRDLPGYDGRAERERVAREYSRQDLVVLAVCSELSTRYGMRKDAIATVLEDIRKTLSSPRSAAVDARLVITVSPVKVEYAEEADPIEDGLVLPLKDIFSRVDGHLATESSSEKGYQHSFDLGPVALVSSSSRHRISSSSDISPTAGGRKVGGGNQ